MTEKRTFEIPLPEDISMDALRAEIVKARLKFPTNKHLLAALMEEVGELAKALMEDTDRDNIEREAIQVACVAMRILEEGDPQFPFEGCRRRP